MAIAQLCSAQTKVCPSALSPLFVRSSIAHWELPLLIYITVQKKLIKTLYWMEKTFTVFPYI